MQVGTDEVHEFLSGVLVLEKRAGEFGGGGHGVLLLDAAHGHAQVLGFDNHANSERVEHLLQAVFDLCSQSLLQLKASCEARGARTGSISQCLSPRQSACSLRGTAQTPGSFWGPDGSRVLKSPGILQRAREF